MRSTVASLFFLMCAAVAEAQVPQTGAVSGTVYDSVGRAPLRGAVVQMVPPAGAPLFTATTDARGRYTIPDVSPGKYFAEFHHRAADSLALEPSTYAVEVRGGETAKLDLAIPAPATFIAKFCRTAPSDSLGIFFGMLRDSRTKIGLDSGRVTVRWSELIIDTSGLHSAERRDSSVTNREGWFAVCGVPAGAELLARGAHGGDTTGVTLVEIPKDGLRRLDLDVGGVAAVRGRITSRGRPVENARIRVDDDGRGAFTDSAGTFRLGAVRGGSQTIEVRALGYSPETRTISLAPDSEATLDVELVTVKSVMDTIRVVAERLYSLDGMGFERRRKLGYGGTFFDADRLRRNPPFSVTTLLYEVSGLYVRYSGFDTFITMRSAFVGRGECIPTLFVNGMQMPGELNSEMDFIVPVRDLEAMEVYRSNMVPPEFTTPGGCGAIVAWTSRLPKPKR
jgi:hypothetical protein